MKDQIYLVRRTCDIQYRRRDLQIKSLWKDLNALHAYLANELDVEYINVKIIGTLHTKSYGVYDPEDNTKLLYIIDKLLVN